MYKYLDEFSDSIDSYEDMEDADLNESEWFEQFDCWWETNF